MLFSRKTIRLGTASICWCCVFVFAGCKVGPDYSRPNVEYLQESWSDNESPRFSGPVIDERTWWRVFNDPVLDGLIEAALANNLDLKQAGQRILEARAIRQVAAGNLFPQQQSANAGYNRIGISENDANFVVVPGFFQTATTFSSFTSNFSAAWELDFWGKYRRIIETADANIESTMAAYDLAKVLLVGEVARTYIDLRTIEQRILLAKKNIDIQAATLKLTEVKLEAGTAVKLDYHQSKSILAQTESVVPTLEILRREANHQLCVLLGQLAQDTHSAIGVYGGVPQPPQAVAIGIPCDLLRRRPDIQIAERELAAQSARIGIAKADFYPQLSLIGTIGVSAQDISNLFRSSSLVGVTGPAASWNILNYGRIKNRVIAEQEAFERLRLAYHDTVLKAYQETQDSQVAFVNYWDRMQDLEEAAQNAAAAVTISQTAFAEGATDFNRVYLLQSELVKIQDSLAENQGQIAQSLVNLYVSLGGGWDISGIPCYQQIPVQHGTERHPITEFAQQPATHRTDTHYSTQQAQHPMMANPMSSGQLSPGLVSQRPTAEFVSHQPLAINSQHIQLVPKGRPENLVNRYRQLSVAANLPPPPKTELPNSPTSGQSPSNPPTLRALPPPPNFPNQNYQANPPYLPRQSAFAPNIGGSSRTIGTPQDFSRPETPGQNTIQIDRSATSGHSALQR